MKNILDRLEDLPPERRELLIKLLKQQDKQVNTFPFPMLSSACGFWSKLLQTQLSVPFPRAST